MATPSSPAIREGGWHRPSEQPLNALLDLKPGHSIVSFMERIPPTGQHDAPSAGDRPQARRSTRQAPGGVSGIKGWLRWLNKQGWLVVGVVLVAFGLVQLLLPVSVTDVYEGSDCGSPLFPAGGAGRCSEVQRFHLQLGLFSLFPGLAAAAYWYFRARPRINESVAEDARGWHADPLGTNAWRWWDGKRWTDHTASTSEKPDTNPTGWHADPLGTHAWRWWDGSSWTDHFSDAPTPSSTNPRG